MGKFSKFGKNLFYFDYKSALYGLKHIKQIFLTFKELIPNLRTYYKISKIQKRVIADLKYNLHCKIDLIRDSYIFVGKDHLEVNPFYGIFLYNTHRLEDIFPNITFVGSKKEQDVLAETFADSLCNIQFIIHEFNKDNILLLNSKYDSISLNFVVDTIKGSDEIRAFFTYLKAHLNPGGMIFGVTVCGINTNLTKKQIRYIKRQNEDSNWFNINTSPEIIQDILYELFDFVGVETIGSCIIFRASLYDLMKDVLPHKLDIDTVGNKYILIK